MRALSVRQPWTDLILFEGKDIENRTWPLPKKMIGQRIYLHAGKKLDKVAAQDYYPPDGALHANRLGSILGEVTITGCVTSSDSLWFQGPYGFVLADPTAYDQPIPCKGMYGFFEPSLNL